MTGASSNSVHWIRCGEFANLSEETAVKGILQYLDSVPTKPRWLVLSNVMVVGKALEGPDEMDVVAVGPTGLFAIEVKHWDQVYIERHPTTASSEARKAEMKARKLAGLVRQKGLKTWVQSCLLLTKDTRKLPSSIDGVPVHTVATLDVLFATGTGDPLTHAVQNQIVRLLAPAAETRLSGRLQSFAGIDHLRLVTPPGERFHRVYEGLRAHGQEPVLLHWFDLTASPVKQSEHLARRAFESYRALQKEPCVPRIVDSFQAAPDYPGEVFFYTVEDPKAPALKDRAKDPQWTILQRMRFASRCIKAVRALHVPQDNSRRPVVHRALSPSTILVTSDDEPILVGFEWAHVAGLETISVAANPGERHEEAWIPPEVAEKGLQAADAASDVYAVCASLATTLGESAEALDILSQGTHPDPAQRVGLEVLAEQLDTLEKNLAPPHVSAPEVSAQFWSEGTLVHLRDGDNHATGYRIIAKLGSGGMGTTYKAVETVQKSGEELGLYVLKTVHRETEAEAILAAYRHARPYVGNGSAKVYEIADEWSPSRPVAVLEWVEGAPLDRYATILELCAGDLNRALDDMLVGWLISLGHALAPLHRNGLVHGDVTPTNIIVGGDGDRVTLTDYDGVTQVGHPLALFNPSFASPSVRQHHPVSCADDIVSLAASLYYALTEKMPFTWDGAVDLARGLDLTDPIFADLPHVSEFLGRATTPGADFRDADDALAFIETILAGRPEPNGVPFVVDRRQRQVVERLHDILAVYPGSSHGNAEARGLDSAFAWETYVETELDRRLLDYVKDGAVHLVVLLGNAGDGKTALLQRLVRVLTDNTTPSAERIWQQTLPNGRLLYINFDGSAAYRGRSSSDLLDELFAPFLTQDWGDRRLHILAINSGPLKQWLAEAPEQSRVVQDLTAALAGNPVADANIRVIDLNDRSLVGTITDGELRSDFVDAVIDRFLGGSGQTDPWQVCRSCSAQDRCTAYASVTSLRDPVTGRQIRDRLARALQMVHQRGEVHITARELRATVSFGFFGTDSCEDLHGDPDRCPDPFYKRFFDPDAQYRQGELLAELAWLDPALEVEPELDRLLLKRDADLAAMRRASYFLASEPDRVPALHQSRYYDLFQRASDLASAQPEDVLAKLLRGLSSVGTLPPPALQAATGLCLQVPGRAETETVFWVEKEFERFRLQAPANPAGLACLPTRLELLYTPTRGSPSILPLTLELFEFLMALADGSQLAADPRSVDVYARLAVFLQQLAEEDRRRLYGWNPLDPETVYVVQAAGGVGQSAFVDIAPRRVG